MNAPRQRVRDTIAPSINAMALTAITALTFGRVFTDHTYLRSMLVVALGAHLAALLLRVLRIPTWAALPLLAFTLIALAGAVYFPSTMLGPLPTGRCIHALVVELRSAMRGFATAVAPVASTSTFAHSAAIALGACALLADTFAFRARGRIESILPTAVLFITTAALDTGHRRLDLLAAWSAVAILQVGLLRLAHTNLQVTWVGRHRAPFTRAIPALTLTVALVVGAAVWLTPRLPGATSPGLLQRSRSDSSVTQVVSPMVDIRNRLNRESATELFSVETSDGAPHNWRLMGLALFDGVTWSPQTETLGSTARTPPGATNDGHAVRQRFTIANLTGHLVPSAAYPTTVSPSAVLFTAQSQGLLVPSTQLQAGDSIMVWSNITPLSPAKLRRATASNPPSGPYLDLPGDLPPVVAETARQVTARARTPYEQMLALQQWFRTQFTYDRTVQFGGGTGAIVDFLEAKRGFCQQFSATFAAMARTLGVPARIGVGFTPGVLGPDGRFHVYGRHAHAWPEVWFDGIGWVPFEPTPGRGNPDTTSVSGVPFQQDEAPVDTTPVTSTTLAPTTSRQNNRPTTSIDRPSTTTTPQPGDTGGSTWPIWLLVTAAAIGAAAVVAVRRRRPLGAMTSAERVDRAWSAAVRLMVRHGAPAIGGATPLEYATSVTELADLAALVTRCVYAPAAATDGDADRAEQLVEVLTRSLRDRRRQP